MKFRLKPFFILVLALSMGTPFVYGGPTIIRDNRVSDLSITPVLGRGYSIGTNTYQSTCMEKVVLTEPSYDMKYSFTQIDDTGSEVSSTSEQKLSDQSSSERKSQTKSKTSYKASWFGRGSVSGNYSTTRSGVDESVRSIAKSTVINGKTYHNHSMLVTVNLYSYYASLDEGRSKMSTAAKNLLQSQDLPGFFSSCGPYYVRSIGRMATFISIFTYQSESESRDEAFEDQLRTEVSRFSTESKTSFNLSGGWSLSGYSASLSTNKTNSSVSSKDIQEQQRRQSFNQKSETYHLTINTSAYGLGKDKNATLISFDMDSYKAAVKDAFMAMQNPNTGRVSSIEVVPWVENTEFQAYVPLEEVADETTDTETGETTVTNTRLLYEKKHILNQNAEFFMEVERTDRNKINMFYKARLCKKNINTNFKSGDSLKGDYAEAMLVNHRGGTSVTLQFLDEQLTDDYVLELLTKETEFMYGTGDDFKGASECIRRIMDEGIYKKSYRQIVECQALLPELGEVQVDLLENFCMPEILY